jgi:tetratricopeptide (TPR) repeat protein
MEDAILQFALAWEEAKGREDVCGRCESCLALAGAFRQQGNTHRAALYQQLALAAGSDAVAEGFPQEFRLIQALLLRECGQSAAAEEQLSALIAASQDGDLQGQASRLLAELRLEHSDLTAAMRLLAAGARQFLSAGNAHASGEALERLAELLLRARRWRRAVRSLRAAEWLARRCGQKELAGRRRGLRVRLQRSLAILAGEPERN